MFKLARSLFLLLSLASLGFSTTASDDFAGTGAVSASWTEIRSGLTRTSGKLTSTSSFGIIQRNDITPTNAQYTAAIVGVNAADIFSGQSFLFLRMVDIDNYYYVNMDDLRHDAVFGRRIAGTNIPLDTFAMPSTVIIGDTIRFTVNSGYVFTLYRNGTQFGTYTDGSGSLSSGGVGLGLSGTGTDMGEWDRWEGGDSTGGGGGGTTPATVSSDPSNTTVTEPATANFTVSASGTAPITYQWQRGSTNVSTGTGGTTASYTTAATTVGADNGATFRCIVSNAYGADTSAAATLTVNATPPTGLPWSEDFESIDSTTWASCANGDEFSAGTGGWTNIGKCYSGIGSVNRVGRFGVSHGGTRSARIKLDSNEHEARFRRNHINRDSVFLRMWLYFDANYDHAFGEKLLRMSSLDSSDGTHYFDNICYLRTNVDPATAGKDDMGSITCEPNGGSGDFGNATISFPRSTWFEIAVAMKLNTAGGSNGTVRIWYNDSLILNSTGLSNMRTSSKGGGYNHLTDTHKYTYVTPTGWYSNGSGGYPNVPAIKYIDDICIDTVKCASLVSGGGGSPPVVTVDPSNATVLAPATTTFNVTATGATSYQWQKGSTNVSSGTGGTTASYTIPASALADNGTTYRCIVTNADGADTSAAATLTVNQVPIITVDPSNATVTAPATNAFTSTTTGTAPITYQWQKNGTNIGGATSSGYTTPATTYADNGAVFRVIATNAFGADTSAGATLTVNSLPVITVDPLPASKIVGQTANFTVTAIGNATLTYQWQKGTTNVASGTGGTTASYTTPTLILGDNGNAYRVIVTNAFGADTSASVTLSVSATSNRAKRSKMGFSIGIRLGL